MNLESCSFAISREESEPFYALNKYSSRNPGTNLAPGSSYVY